MKIMIYRVFFFYLVYNFCLNIFLLDWYQYLILHKIHLDNNYCTLKKAFDDKH